MASIKFPVCITILENYPLAKIDILDFKDVDVVDDEEDLTKPICSKLQDINATNSRKHTVYTVVELKQFCVKYGIKYTGKSQAVESLRKRFCSEEYLNR